MKPIPSATVESPQLRANNDAAIGIANRVYGRKFEREKIWVDEFITPNTLVVVRTHSAEGNGPLMTVERHATAPEKLRDYLDNQSYGGDEKYTTVAVPGFNSSEAVLSYMYDLSVKLTSTRWRISVVGPVEGQANEKLRELARELLLWADQQQ